MVLQRVVDVMAFVFVAAGVAAVAAAYFRAQYTKATIDTLKESNAALNERNEQLEAEVDRCTRERNSYKAENDNLKTYVSGTEAITHLADQVRSQHESVVNEIRKLRGGP